MNNLLRQMEKDAIEFSPTILGIFFGLFLSGFAIYLGKLLASTPDIELSDCIQLFILVVIACTLGFSIYIQSQKEQLDESQAFLDRSIDLINKAYDVLSSGGEGVTTDRVAWVTAARLLTRASALSSKIKLPWHREIYESEHDFQRHRFGDLLMIDEKPLPVEFFFGTGYVPGSVGDSAYKTLTKTGENWLPVRVVSTIFQFKSFPKDFVDPLDSSRVFSKEELERLWLFDERGVHDYVVFRNHFTTVCKKVFKTNQLESSVEVDSTQINKIMSSLSGHELE